MRETEEFRRGRIGEILQYWMYHGLGVDLLDLADRTENRAPLLQGTTSIISPDVAAIKTAEFFIEFKTKTHHQEWRGGSPGDENPVPRRFEEGIDASKLRNYLAAETRWRKPVVLSVLSIKEAELRAATLWQLGNPRHSPNPAWKLVNWDIRQFSLIARFDSARLSHILTGREPKAAALRNRWLERAPKHNEVKPVLDWLRPTQGEFVDVRQFIFDQIEAGFHK